MPNSDLRNNAVAKLTDLHLILNHTGKRANVVLSLILDVYEKLLSNSNVRFMYSCILACPHMWFIIVLINHFLILEHCNK